MSKFFNASEACPKSKELLFHSAVTTVRCGRCTLLNPNYIESPGKQLVSPTRAPIDKEIIEIEESPTTPKPAIPPAQRRGLATQIPTLPNFKLGYAEKERQLVDQRLTERKTKTSFLPAIPIIHFSVAVAHWVYNDLEGDEGHWITASSQWSIDEDNRELTSDALLVSLLSQTNKQSKRAILKKWVSCDGGDWSLGHTNPVKGPARDVAPWDQPRLLSTVIDSAAYEQKIVVGTARKLVSVWLYWTPEPPPAVQASIPTPRRPTKKTKIKKEKGIKEEKGVREGKGIKVEPTLKRLRAASGEVSVPKRSGVVTTRRQAKALDEGPSEDDDLESLTEMMGGVGSASKSAGEVHGGDEVDSD
jgi:hypothetical protein